MRKRENYRVYIFSTVTLKHISNRWKKTITLVNDTQSDVKSGKISINTPIAKGLLGKKKGDIVCILLPSGKKTHFRILKVNFRHVIMQ